ncbi:hypothetical protein [Winkia neuii]|uniref:hypothetical protein n=1 Tax=Winkia neuii TaxID=33007 RepID=UPI0003FA031F|nr:hypothetical protein [Winkia neuii]
MGRKTRGTFANLGVLQRTKVETALPPISRANTHPEGDQPAPTNQQAIPAPALA